MKITASVIAILMSALPATSAAPGPASVTSDAQVKISVLVAPQPVGAGSDASVTVTLDPKTGIKMNKYPKIKLQIPAVPDLVGPAEQSIGNSAPPPADQLDANYFHGAVDPLSVTLHVDAKAAAGRHEIHAKVSYFYCVAASGYCAPAKAELTIPVTIR